MSDEKTYDSLIVYNTPFDCQTDCPYCYLKKTVDMSKVDIASGIRTLNQKLVSDKKSTLVISITNNPLSYEHTRFILKKTKHLRKFRETQFQVNVIGTKITPVLEIANDWGIDEISLSLNHSSIKQAISTCNLIRAEYSGRISGVYTITDELKPEELEEDANRIKEWLSSLYILPIIDREEIRTMHRTIVHMPVIMQLVLRNENVILTPCTGAFHKPTCPVTPKTYTEITGDKVIHGCPYGLYNECKKPVEVQK